MKRIQWTFLLVLTYTAICSQTIDTTFAPSVLRGSGTFGILAQPDNQYLVTTGSNQFINEVPVRYLFRMTEDGKVDSTFEYSEVLTSAPQAVQLQEDGKVVIGGRFYDQEENFLGNLLRLMPDGSLDSTFEAYADEAFFLSNLAILTNQKILAAGHVNSDTGLVYSIFLTQRDGGPSADFPKLDFAGARPGNTVHIAAVDIQSDNELIVAGTNLQIGSLTRDIWRLDSTGVPDLAFDPAFRTVSNFRIRSIGILPDGTMGILAGDQSNFTIVDRDGLSSHFFQLPLSEGSQGGSMHPFGEDSFFIYAGVLSQVFTSGISREFLHLPVDRSVWGIAGQSSDSTLLVAGQFSNVGGNFKPGLLRLNLVDESVLVPRIDDSFAAGIYTNGIVSDVVVQEDEKLVIAGTFHLVDGQRVNHVARIFPDGALDTTFNLSIAQIERPLSSIEQQSNGNLVLTGRYVVPRPDARFNGIAIVDKDGFQLRNLDFSSRFCQTGCSSTISYLDLDSRDRIFAGMSVAYRFNEESGQDLNRFSADGFLEADYNELYINSLIRHNGFEVLPDGRMLLYGYQMVYDGSDSTYIIRANADGQRDQNFLPLATTDLITTSVLSPNPDFILASGHILNENRSITGNFFHKLDSLGQIAESSGMLFERADGRTPTVSRMYSLPGDRILLSGNFDTYDGLEIAHNAVVIDSDCQFVANYLPTARALSIASLTPIDENHYYLSGSFDFGNGTTAVIRVIDDITSVESSAVEPPHRAVIFPNPMRSNEEVLNVQLSQRMTGELLRYQIVEASSGKIARNGQFVANEVNSLKTSALPAGTYLLRLIHPQFNDGLLFVRQ